MSEKLKKKMEELEIDVPELCKRSRVHKETIYRILKNEIKRSKISTYQKLAEALDCNVGDIID